MNTRRNRVRQHSLYGAVAVPSRQARRRMGQKTAPATAGTPGFTVEHGIDIGSRLLDFTGGLIQTKNEREISRMETERANAERALLDAQVNLRRTTDAAEAVNYQNVIANLQNQIANTQSAIVAQSGQPGGGMVLTPAGWLAVAGVAGLTGFLIYNAVKK